MQAYIDKTEAKNRASPISELPLELVERIADFVAVNSQETHQGPRYVNPLRNASPKQNLVAFASTCKTFRIAAIRHLPELSRDITLYAFSELERIRDEEPLRKRLAPHVRHITLNFSIPLVIGMDRLRRALVVLCLHPAVDTLSLPNLEGISFSSLFLSSYVAHSNIRKNWQEVARQDLGLTGWQATVIGGLASFTTLIAGGQPLERFGDVECLFLKWDPAKGEKWTAGHDMVFQSHYAPALSVPNSPNLPLKLLITPFKPSAPKQPPLFAHPSYHASYFLLSSVLKTAKNAVSTPLRPFAALNERASHAGDLRDWDNERIQQNGGARPGQGFYDERGTVLMAHMLLEKICFSVPEPDLIDSLK